MTICAIKVCRNYKGRLQTTEKVSYHRIPNDPILRRKWIDIVRKSRKEDLWQPAKTSVICSDHFRSKDLYSVKNQVRRRLKKGAIPRKALFLASLVIDDDDDDDNDNDDTDKTDILLEETGNTSVYAANILDDEKSSRCIEDERDTLCIKTDSCLIQEQDDGDKQNNYVESDIVEEFSDLDSIFDTPRKSKMRQDLRRKTRLQIKHTLKIQSLRRKNIRLKKKNASFKQIIETLKRERYIDNRNTKPEFYI